MGYVYGIYTMIIYVAIHVYNTLMSKYCLYIFKVMKNLVFFILNQCIFEKNFVSKKRFVVVLLSLGLIFFSTCFTRDLEHYLIPFLYSKFIG